MSASEENLQLEVQQISRIPFLPILLEVVCLATGMGFAAVARVNEERWIAGAVRDDIAFGLEVGGELPVQTTICHEIRERKLPVIIDHVSHDIEYCDHQTPAIYGFQSYISFPIIRKNGDFFGTLCAIDPGAANLNNPSITGLFTILADLIAHYLDGMQSLERSSRSRLAMYAEMEMSSARRDLAVSGERVEGASVAKMQLLSMKIRQLMLMIDNL